MKHSKLWRALMMALPMLLVSGLTMAVMAAIPADYKGKPWKDKPQEIPGKVWGAYYDVGGNGVAYNNKDTKNHGSGELNRGPEEKNNFRKDEGISISYTKAAFDKWQDGKLLDIDEYYVGWTSTGESVNYTVDVKEAGTYVVNMKASANNDNTEVSLAVNSTQTTGPIKVEKTGYYHTWHMYNNIAELKLDKGLNVVTFKFEKEGNMNFMWLEFVPKGKDAPAATPTKEAPKATPTADKKG
jgi:Carbohydrate binding module (family 6)